MKQILKSLRTNGKKSAALFIELVIVTVVGWMVIEPVAVDTSLALMPAGYDYDRLVKVDFSNFDYQSELYDSTSNDNMLEKQRLLTLIRENPDVEYATYHTHESFESGSSSSSGLDVDSIYGLGGDDRWISSYIVSYIPKTDFFATFGIKDANGDPFKEPQVSGGEFIVNKTLAKARYADGSAIGKDLYTTDEEDDYPTPIVGVTEDTPYRKADARQCVAFRQVEQDMYDWSLAGITMRLRPDVNGRVFTDRLTSQISDYRAGNTYLSHPVLMSDARDEKFAKKSREIAKGWIVLAFFLVNVILGVAGTFYIQSRSRATDSGVMRAFGATRRRVEWQIVGEALITVVIAWAIGSLLYCCCLYFAEVTPETYADKIVEIVKPMWFDQPATRYGLVGAVVLLLLLAVTFIGVWFPARKIGRIQPVDALRDE